VKFLLLLILAAAFVPGAAMAQVSVNPDALTQLAGMPVLPPVAVPETAPKAKHAAFVRQHHVTAKVKASPVAPMAAPLPAVPPPVPAPAIAKPAIAQPAIAQPVVAKPVVPKPVVPSPAPAAPKPVAPPAPVDITFAAGSATLPTSAQARLAPFCKASGPITINARAPADPDDNSHSMRLSLARALAVRASLSACGVASQNILPRALGAGPGGANDITEIQTGLNP
jgi:outer membrane protein OmpA-like peptidoglycan-associated protein